MLAKIKADSQQNLFKTRKLLNFYRKITDLLMLKVKEKDLAFLLSQSAALDFKAKSEKEH